MKNSCFDMIQVSGYISYCLHLPVDIQTDSGEGSVKLGSQRGASLFDARV